MASEHAADRESTGEDVRPGDAAPGPDGLPLVGNTLSFLRDPVGFYRRLGAYGSDVVAYDIAGTSGYAVTHPDDVEQVLVHDDALYERGTVTREALGQISDGGLFLSEGEDWARQRRLLQPAFYRGTVETYAGTMTATAADVADGWADGDVVHARDAMTDLTLAVLSETLFGVDLSGRGAAVGDAATALLAKFDSGAPSAYLPEWVPTPRNRRFRRAVGDLRELVDELVAERRGAGGTGSAGDAGSTAGIPRGDDVLSLLAAADADAEDGLSDEDIRANMLAFLVAGHETTALALTFALHSLATHPDVQDRLAAELGAELDGPPGADDLADLDVLDRVVEETLRLYPPAYTVFREPTEPVTLGGYRIEPGANLSLPQFVVHRDGRWYDDPTAFRPSRWDGDLRESNPDYAYFPFGGGPRACIGMRFARMEAKLALATLLTDWRVEPTDETALSLRMAVTLGPGGPVPLRVRRRDGA
jgi:cytochrome P450